MTEEIIEEPTKQARQIPQRKPRGERMHPAIGARIFTVTAAVSSISFMTMLMSVSSKKNANDLATQKLVASLTSLQQSLLDTQAQIGSLQSGSVAPDTSQNTQNNGIINTSANTGASKILPATSVPKKKPVSGGVTQTTIKQGSTTSQAPVPTNTPTTAQTTTTVPAPAPCVTTVSGKCV